MEESYISWNAPNWITIVLMVAVAGMIVSTLAKIVGRRKAAE